jgi:hypothetical protein
MKQKRVKRIGTFPDSTGKIYFVEKLQKVLKEKKPEESPG